MFARTQRLLAYVRDEDMPKGMRVIDFHHQLLERLKAWLGSDLEIELAGDDIRDREILCRRIENMVRKITGWRSVMLVSPPDPPNGHSVVILGRSVELDYKRFKARFSAAHPGQPAPTLEGMLPVILAKPPAFTLGMQMTFDRAPIDRAPALAADLAQGSN